MKTYELIIERAQPSCGGKSPKEVQVQTVTTDDPAAYVRSVEKNGELNEATTPDGEIVITLGSGLTQVKYSFTEM